MIGRLLLVINFPLTRIDDIDWILDANQSQQ